MKHALMLLVPAMALGGMTAQAQAPAAGQSKAAQAVASQAPQGQAQAGGRRTRVQMKQVGARYVFEPQNFTVRVGETIDFVNVNGFPHNVQFEAAQIPQGAAEVLNRNMPQRLAALQGPMMTEPNRVYSVSMAGVPPGRYGYFCLPHKALGMTGTITVNR